jgi:hypothetical protein
MNLKVGDLLIFIGNKNLQNKHYDDNFEIGKSYKISNMSYIGYDIDEVTGYYNKCVLFENHTHGCLITSIKDYFLTMEEYRNNKIDKIINI